MAVFPVPEYLEQTAARESSVREWIGLLPQIVTGLASRWSLSVGEPFRPGGQCSWTAPATDASGAALVLKVAFRFEGGEERDEAAGLRAWEGNGAVRMHAACDTGAAYGLLLERCLPGTPLAQALPEPDQDVVVAGLLRRLWPNSYEGYPFRPLAEMCQAWADEFEAGYAAAPPSDRIDPGLAREGIALFRELPGTAASQVLLCTDLHGDNILAARRAPWLVIDPKPYVGDPAYDVLQHMLNCEERLAADPAGLAGLAGPHHRPRSPAAARCAGARRGRDEDGAGPVGGAVLQSALLTSGAAVGPAVPMREGSYLGEKSSIACRGRSRPAPATVSVGVSDRKVHRFETPVSVSAMLQSCRPAVGSATSREGALR